MGAIEIFTPSWCPHSDVREGYIYNLVICEYIEYSGHPHKGHPSTLQSPKCTLTVNPPPHWIVQPIQVHNSDRARTFKKGVNFSHIHSEK